MSMASIREVDQLAIAMPWTPRVATKVVDKCISTKRARAVAVAVADNTQEISRTSTDKGRFTTVTMVH